MNLERFLKKEDSGLDICRLISPEPTLIFGSVKELRESLCLSVRLWGTKCSKAPNLHLSLIGQSQVSPRSAWLGNLKIIQTLKIFKFVQLTGTFGSAC